MTTRRAGIDRRHLHRLVAVDPDPGVTDRELLRRFADAQDETAFETLVRRHAAMVLAAGRRVLGNAADAEDVCQAAFLLLARKAPSHRWQPSVANWLHQTAHLLALKARTAAARRARREGKVEPRTAPDPLAEMTGRELLVVLDEELLALPESLRGPLVLCYLEGATRDEAAGRLGCPLSTLKKRLETGRERLHAALARRGLGLSAALLGTLLAGPAAAVPPALVASTTRAIAALAAGHSAKDTITTRVAQLMNGGIGMTGRNKLTTVLGAMLLGGLLAAAGVAASRTADDKAPAKPKETTAGAKAEPPAEQTRELRVIVLDPQGKPLPGANVHASVWSNEKDFKGRNDVETDAQGVARIELPKTYYILRLWASKKPFAGMYANWEQAELTAGKGVPAEYTVRLENPATAGGWVVDEKGKPVAGAKVRVTLEGDPKPAVSDGRVRYNTWLTGREDAPTTDADGRWKIENVPDHPEAELHLLVTHPDYVTDEHWSAKRAGVTGKMFRDGIATVTLKSGVIVRGRVTDPDGKPVKDAVVIHGDDPYMGHTTSTFATDGDGKYRLPALPAGTRSLTVIAPGFAPQLRKVELKPGLPDQDFRLAAGKPVRLRIVDASGNPVPKAHVWLLEWKGSKSVYSDRNPNHPKVPATGIPKTADASGAWAWPSAPDEPVKVRIQTRGFADIEMEVTGGSTDQTVTLKAEHRVTGAVTDAVTGKPIPAFTLIPVDVFGKDHLHAERFNGVAGKDGRLDYLATRTDISLRLRVQAPGYRSQDGPEFRVGDDTRKQDFRLVPSPARTGRVVDAAGKPVAKAEVLLATPTEQVRLDDDDNHRVFTDAAGRFEFPDPGEPWAVVARSGAGVATAEFPADTADAGTLTLRPWGSVRGMFSDGGKPVAGATVFVAPIRLDTPRRPRLETDFQARTDVDGRFDFPRVPSGPVSVRVYIGPWKDDGYRSGPSVPLDLKPGEKADLELGSGGATLTGKVKLTGKVPADLDCTYSLNFLVRREPGIAPPPDVAAAGFDVRDGWRETWRESAEGQEYLSTLRTWFVKLAADGTFRVSGVPPGEYDLAVAVYAKPSGCLTDPLARQVVRVTVTAEDAARGELKVPEIAAEVVPVPAIGDTPALSFKLADGTDGTLADARGKHTVVHFWASWCGPCNKQLPALRKLHERYADRGLVTVGLSLDDDAEAWKAAVKTFDPPGSQGRVGTAGVPGVSSVPAYWLLDPAGKIVAKAFDPDELVKELEVRLK